MVEASYLTHEQADAAERYFNTPLLNDLVENGLLSQGDLPLVATGDRPATARALNALVKADELTKEEADAAKQLTGSLWQYTRESAQERFEVPPDAPHFALYVLEQLQDKYNTPEDPYFIWHNGLRVYTTLDWDLQVYAECVARSHIGSLQLERSQAVSKRPAGARPRARSDEAEIRSRGHQRVHRRHPAEHRRSADDGGQPGLLRREHRRAGQRGDWRHGSPARHSSPTPI